MKVKIIKPHHFYKEGEIEEVEEGRAKYLISVGVAEEVKEKEKDSVSDDEIEKKEHKLVKEKQELKPGQLPTTKGKDITMANVKKSK